MHDPSIEDSALASIGPGESALGILHGVPRSRLTIPHPIGDRIQRKALVDRLEGATPQLDLVVAPAGFGKTTVLTQWAKATALEVVWLSCRESSGQDLAFWHTLVAATALASPSFGGDAGLILESSQPTERDLVGSLANDLGDLVEPIAIVIDDFHLAKLERGSLIGLAEAMPGGSRLILCSRRDPSFSLAKLRLDGAVFELRARDLAFSRAEQDELLCAAGTTLDEDDLKRLYGLVEGWPAGTQLAAAALRRSGAPSRVIDALSTSSREVNDYLVNEVLERLGEDFSDFVTEISVLDQFDATLCKAVSSHSDAAELFDELLASDLFLMQVDGTDQQYRFHHLFRDFLRARLRSLGEGRLLGVCERAAEVLEESGDRNAAVELAMIGGDAQLAAAIVARAVETSHDMSNEGNTHVAIRAWLRRFGNEAVSSDPERTLQLLLVLAASGGQDVTSWLTELERAIPDDDAFLRFLLHAVWAASDLAQGASGHALSHNEVAFQWAQKTSRRHPLLQALPSQLANISLIEGDLVAASHAMEWSSVAPLHPPVGDVLLSGIRAWLAFLRGELVLALREADLVDHRADELNVPFHAIGRTLVDMVQAGLALEHGELIAAEGRLATAERAARLSGPRSLECYVLWWQARLAVAQGNPDTASVCLTEAAHLFPAPSAAVLANMALEQVRRIAAFAHGGLKENLDVELPDRLASRLLRARIAIAQDNFELATGLLGPATTDATVRERVESGVLRALVESRNNVEAALVVIRDALVLARAEGFARTVLEQGAGVGPLLRALPSDPIIDGYVDELLTLADASIAPLRQTSTVGLVAQLSPREMTVLRYLSSRLPICDIAAALYVSNNTLKSHVKSIYRKFGVQSRAEAVGQGQALGLI
jgi:LuxR family transcriptional regulator, maltose regulon positive regulatory protein